MPYSRSYYWVDLYIRQIETNIAKAFASKGGDNQIGFSAAAEASLGLSEGSDGAIDHMLNLDARAANKSAGGVQTSNTLTDANTAGKPAADAGTSTSIKNIVNVNELDRELRPPRSGAGWDPNYTRKEQKHETGKDPT